MTAKPNPQSSAWNRALGLLARREHSALELRQKLRSKGVDAELIEPLLERLAECGYQSEQRFAESFTRSRVVKGLGPYRIRKELQERGVGEIEIEQAMAPFEDRWVETAIAVKEKKFGLEQAQEFRERAKQQRFLQYRGFTHEQIQVAVEHRNS
ncbi:MAG: regulatory protein RecX [Gammaproteobacteria bacterium]|nr:regulatory protein RecX [Gammaproteobacteria bacterium]MBT3489681.1 regulatory protein RecX [Gammaproteobacteria bacterium]MBT3717743.1 regulatory protein RecX [Gammaproteobacteria bacterium]MBT3845096.1 regulatory protein RecX [Gammaproteobacteria bacterium]MBT3894020.1 regulatory protein RecX [Gammaproteobacteria bacterium]